MNKDQISRYARHLVLKEIGGPGQAELLNGRAVIIGAGGLGGPAGLYLAAAGLGHITIIDDDKVEASNLQRQVQFTTADIGKGKARIMADALMALNPDVKTHIYETRLSEDNAQSLIEGADVILDGTDNFETRFAINGAAVAQNIPLVSGALGRFEGQLSAFENNSHKNNMSKNGQPCYRCLVPDIPPDAQTCAAVGVVGALAGMIGSMMALEAIKIITGAGTPLYGQLFLYDGLSMRARIIGLPQDPACPACGAGE